MRKDSRDIPFGWCLLLVLAAVTLWPAAARAQGGSSATPATPRTGAVNGEKAKSDTPETGLPAKADPFKSMALPDLSKKETFSSALQIIILLTVLSLAPAILIMMTSFTRIVIVLSLLRQALGTQSLPPNQIIIGLSLFMTFLIMGPTWKKINDTALKPYMEGRKDMDQKKALALAVKPLREFMITQIDKAGNNEDVLLFTDFAHQPEPKTYDQVDTMTLIPAFMLSELKTAFLLGFKIYLPFLIIDMVISAILISMGMMMLPPVLISLPFKLLLFVMVDGWRLITGNLIGSFIT